ncbi:hypothetical protein Hypma_013001 [Hypsizygus marmoreus]|uniref:DUF4470 domain-containing protein n=1 Tax=Hypsizygus marmoreus TaxID=39966 RepID=A0A369JFY2_HYPMA|nr:hypothetical protein Hypma_013001 [Hypsizygus marmoreus]
MAHPVFWPKKKFFYPIGNTPPVSFTQDLALEIPADVLLLGCGDPRSILYTVYADHGAPNRNLDFTCCDADPAILVQAKYNDMFVTTASRSAGPLWPYVVQAGGEHFRHYWATGITFQESSSHQATLVNPTLAYSASGRGFNMHYGTDPILAVHLSMVSTLATCNDDTFHDRVTRGSQNMVIRFFAGDALAFSGALHFCRENNTTETGLYISPWVDTQINLDGGGYDKRSGHRAPSAFNNIDTSNLTDHLGLLDILLATLALLMKTPVPACSRSSMMLLIRGLGAKSAVGRGSHS